MKAFICVLGLLFISISAHAQNDSTHSDSDRIIGVWLNNKEEAQIEIYEKENKFFGKIVWLAEPNKKDGTPKTDLYNPNPELRNREIMGLDVIANLKDDNGEWVGGKMYIAKKGHMVNCKMKLSEGNEKLFITVSKGMFFSKKITWIRVK